MLPELPPIPLPGAPFVNPTTATNVIFGSSAVQIFTIKHNVMIYQISTFTVAQKGIWVLTLMAYDLSDPDTIYFMVGAVYIYDQDLYFISPEMMVSLG